MQRLTEGENQRVRTLAGESSGQAHYFMTIPQDLLPGDILFYGEYSGESPIDKIFDGSIEWKTASDVDHVEMVSNVPGMSWASRNGIGVGIYPFRSLGLKYVRRPLSFDADAAAKFFETVKGAPYGWGDIAENVGVNLPLPGMDCSHLVAAMCEGGLNPMFDRNYDKRKIAPEHLKMPLQSNQIWPV